MDGVPFLFIVPFPRHIPSKTKPRQYELSGFYAYLEQGLLLTLVLVLTVQSAQRLGQLNRVPGVAHCLKGGASTGVTVRGTDTTGHSSAGRERRIVQRGDIQCIELGIIQTSGRGISSGIG